TMAILPRWIRGREPPHKAPRRTNRRNHSNLTTNPNAPLHRRKEIFPYVRNEAEETRRYETLLAPNPTLSRPSKAVRWSDYNFTYLDRPCGLHGSHPGPESPGTIATRNRVRGNKDKGQCCAPDSGADAGKRDAHS